jgi:hypothetical protein
MDVNNYKVDVSYTYSLIISSEEKTKNNKMIYLLSSIDIDKYSSKQFINMYLERW